MSDDGDSKLVLRAEAALASGEWREPDWDAFALRVESALGTAKSIDDSLLLPPLPESVEDGREEVAVQATSPSTEAREPEGPVSQRGGASLAELARAAVARRSSKDAVELAKASLAIASQGRALPEATRRPERDRAAPATPAPAPVAAVVSSERERNTVPPARRERAAVDTRGPWIGVAIATVGLAAGFGLYLASRSAPATVAAAPVATAAATAASVTPAPSVVAKAETTTEPRPATPELLPVEKQAEAAPLAASAPVAAADAHATAAPRPTAAEARGAATASAARARPEKVVLEEDPSPAATNSPKPAASAMRPAELNSTSGGISDRPSTGAAQAAVGAVLGSARACIAGQPQASSATIVFGSSGEVSGVNVSGPADGTPAAACIKAALSKARVQPFAASSFSLGVTVRPL